MQKIAEELFMNKSQSYKEKSKIAFNHQADRYDSTYNGEHARSLYDRVITIMNPLEYESVLDVGCGTGALLDEVLNRKKVSIAGIDLSEKMLNIARQRLGQAADLKNGDSENLPWADNSFDMVLCTDSFHHYPNPGTVLCEIKRVLKPGGKLIIADPWLPAPARQLANLFMPFSKDGDIKMYSRKELHTLFEKCGFQLLKWETVEGKAFIVTAQR
jgi:Methylase involved in ubiquinone/menaquinone biosynthesis